MRKPLGVLSALSALLASVSFLYCGRGVTGDDALAGSCGDGVRDGDEACDGDDLGGLTCADFGAPGAAGLACSACVVDASGCATCGNGTLEGGEACDDGNVADGDGCESDCTRPSTATVVVCQDLAPLPSGACAVTAGDGGRLIVGTVLAPNTIYRGGQVVVDTSGRITFVGCKADCDADPACAALAASATAITCPAGVVSPGLINTHDHITFTQNDPYTDTGERYEHRHEWRKHQNGHAAIPTSAVGGPNADQLVSWGELRFLFGGATSTVGSGGQAGLLRNLDRASLEEGLGKPEVNFDTFPLDDNDGLPVTPGSCASDYPTAVTPGAIAADDAYLPHVAEGIDARARHEFECLSSQTPAHDIVLDKTALIHGVGLTAPELAEMAEKGTALIWSPRSNVTLYGNTAAVTAAARLGVLIALGTDWIATGSMNVLRELRCADELNQAHFGSYFSDQDLWKMVTENAARVTAGEDTIGVLAAGRVADIAIFDGAVHPDYRAILDADPEDVLVVMRAGKVLYGEAAVVAGVPGSGTCDVVDVCGREKRLCLEGELGMGYATLRGVAGGVYDVFFCDGAPPGEPSCVPTRPASVAGSTVYDGTLSADDGDGDGIPNASDACPTIFDPVRPMDGGAQADFDADGEGDACDPCPLDADTTVCSTFDPDDLDGDGAPNATDNCPGLPNADQLDTDGDDKGDACDPCPTEPNPGVQACPGSASTGLVLNEVDYDQVGTDSGEYVEIYNAGSTPIPLAGIHLVAVNGANGESYSDVDLGPAGTLQPGEYLVVGATSVVSALPPSVRTVDLGSAGNLVQNGSPDGLALVDVTGQALLDTLSYGGALTAVTLTGLPGTHSLVEGTVLPGTVSDSNTVARSIGRSPNGSDTGDAATDWHVCATPTPGAANVP
ncbi:MAG: lamin tail domain-containing protein [Myxococcales bacterium]|nr:lamin tail domain-containing protein [Myxococcales bacterium]